MGADCKSVANAYTGSNPVPATQLSPPSRGGAELFEGAANCHGLSQVGCNSACPAAFGCSSGFRLRPRRRLRGIENDAGVV